MKGYIIIDTEVVDQQEYADFVSKIPSIIAAHGGRFIVRTSDAESFQGSWMPKRLVILEFDSPDAARGYLSSEDFMALDAQRRRSSNSKILVVEGCA